eukprot:g8813.t1
MAQRMDCLLAVLVGLLCVQVGQVYYISRLNAKCQCEEAQITLRQQFAGAQPSEQAENLLQELESLATGSLYLVDPYIHIWAGYDDASNLPDGDHQIVFERHQQELKPFEHRFSFVRDFSHSFLVTYKGTPGSPPISLYVDNTQTHKAIVRDLDDWWGLMAPGGIAAGPQYNEKIEVKAGVNEFAAKMGLQVQLFADQQTWYLVKRG